MYMNSKEEEIDDIWEDESFVKELDRRTKELESGKVKGYSWEEVKEITKKDLAKIDRFYDNINMDFSSFKFDREEANER